LSEMFVKFYRRRCAEAAFVRYVFADPLCGMRMSLPEAAKSRRCFRAAGFENVR